MSEISGTAISDGVLHTRVEASPMFYKEIDLMMKGLDRSYV